MQRLGITGGIASSAPERSADRFRNRVQRRYLEKNYPILAARMRGVAAAFGKPPDDDAWDFSGLGYLLGPPPGCSVVYYPPGVTGELLLQQLERRLDNVVFRLGFAQSRRQARQLVRHGHVAVNNRKVNIPSYEVSAGEEISIRENSKKLAVLELAKEFASHGTLPNWLEVDRDAYKARVLSLPKREDIQLPVNEQLIVELYSK